MANDFKEIWMREGLQEGRQKGWQKGWQEGRQEGRQEGLEKGIQEGARMEDMKIARILKEAGVDVNTIANATGLTVDEIIQL
jgi:predicted transposase YdaD